jgi:zinc protease
MEAEPMTFKILVRRIAALMLAAAPSLAFAVLPIEAFTTSHGTRVLFVQAPSIPMLDVQVDFDAGGRFDPPAKAGLASLVASLLSRGFAPGPAGEPAMSEADVAQAFAMLGSQRSSSASDDRASVSLRTLTSSPELERSLALMSAMISRPAFPDSVFTRERQRALQAVREASIKPETIAQQRFNQRLYGDHPYGINASESSLQAIATADLMQFYRAAYRPERATISMIGAINRAQAQQIAERLMGDLVASRKQRGDEKIAAPVPPPAVTAPIRASIDRVAHPATQSHILIGQRAIARSDPDFLKLLVGNYILGGGGFVSRLYGEVREKRGMAYSVYSFFSPQLQQGSFIVGLQTQKEQTDQALDVARQTLRRFVDEGPTEAELAAAKSNLIGGFALRIDSNRKILDNLANINYHRLPLDYLERWTAEVASFTVKDIREAFARVLRPDAMAVVVVGAGGS